MDIHASLLQPRGGLGEVQSREGGFASGTQELEAVIEDAEEVGTGLLDFNLLPSQVIERIESCAAWMTHEISCGNAPEISLPAAPATVSQAFQPASQATAGASAPQTLTLLGRHTASADRFARLWAVLAASHEILTSGIRATQRDLHYRLKPRGGNIFRSHAHMGEAIQDAVRLLRVPRSSLGITCSSKGLVGGNLLLYDSTTGATTDCAAAANGVPIPGDITAIASLSFSTTASVVLVVEKDTVFQQLLQDTVLIKSGRALVVTGKGVPDVATRAFLSALHTACPALVILGLVDWNPSGVGILLLYRFGSHRMEESTQYVLPGMRWLGARTELLRGAAADSFHELGPRDVALIPGLKTRLAVEAPAWVSELEAMEAAGAKADIEALYTSEGGGGAAGLGGILAERIQARDWV